MNFLAHAYLSGSNPEILVGNFIADFVKGKHALENFNGDVVKGIELHRLIDEFTDTHPIVRKSKDRLRPTYRHYSAVIVDVFYDHFLASNWNNYHPAPLTSFADHVYKIIQHHDAILPEGARYMLPYMMSGNWLVNYAELAGIERALSGMARRTPYLSKMEKAVADLQEHYHLFKSEFVDFFPALQQTCRQWLRAHNFSAE